MDFSEKKALSGIFPLKVLGAEFRAGNKTTRNELVAVLHEHVEERYTKIKTRLKQQQQQQQQKGNGVLSRTKGGDDFTKDSFRVELNKVFAARREEIMDDIKECHTY